MSTLTLNGLLLLKSAINHVPPTYSMRRKDFQGFSLRSVIIHEIMATCASECCLTLSDVYFYVSFLERHCPKFISTSEFLPKDKLWKLCDGCRYRYAKFLSPPLQCCLNCSEGVTMHNPPSNPTLFTLEGPIPASKITLECKDCGISYGIGRYADKTGLQYYPKSVAVDLIEVTNTTYMSPYLYRWLPSLR